MSFVHLHTHSEYSLSSSLLTVDAMAKKAKAFGMPALALTDWNNLYGVLYHLKACKKNEIKPIYGVEMGVTVEGAGPQLRHVVLLAQNKKGYTNLQNLVTASHIEHGFEEGIMRPKLPLELLLRQSDDLILLTAGLKGVLNSFVLQDQEGLAQETLRRLKEAFKDRLYLELQPPSITGQHRCNERLAEWAQRESLPLVGTCDAHYLTADDAFAQEVWMMTSQKLTLEENPRNNLVSTDYYFRSAEEMKEIYADYPDACENSLRIAEQCNVKLKFTDDEGKRIYHLPQIPSADDALRAESFGALEKRVEAKFLDTEEKRKEYADRLDFELKIIAKMGFSSYFLIVSDFIRWAKSHDIPVGPGRGSGAGSLVAFVTDITNLDPLEHGLLFERFLNPERVSLPDFDVDFCQERRHEVIRYVADKYGQERVTQIVTFMKEQSKNAIKDVGRVMGLSFGETNRLTKFIPSVQAKPLTIDESLEQVKEFKELVAQDAKIRQVVEVGRKIEGALRQPGVHAAGVIIASQPVAELAPLSRDVNGNLITQWDMKMSEEAGLVKFDFLGLVTLDLLHLACSHVRKRSEPEAKTMVYDNVPIYDQRLYDLIAKGDTLGVFQLESTGMQNLCTRIKPNAFGDLVAINALFRPGPLESGMVDDFIARKHGKKKVEVAFPEMEPSLRETYGTIVYQEQVMEIAKVVSGYSLGGADLLRRAMGKKVKAEMDAQRQIFVDGAVATGKDAKKAADLFDLIEKFAGYGFNKSHAAAYMVLAAQTAYLKAVYPTEFFAALLTIERENTDKLARYILDAKKRDIQVLPPDVNESEKNFTIVGDKLIRFGLAAIKNVGESAVDAIAEARAKGPFSDLFDFLTRVDLRRVNKRTVESLVQAGAFDNMEQSGKEDLRGRYLATLEKAIEWASKLAEEKNSMQVSLFGDFSTTNADISRPKYDRGTPPTNREMLDWEKQLLGIYVSGSPLDKYHRRAKSVGAQDIFDFYDPDYRERNAGKERKSVIVAGMLVEFREVRVKKGKRAGEAMAILKIEDLTGQIEMVSFPDHYKEHQLTFKSGQPLLVRADLEYEEERPKLIGSDARPNGLLSVEELENVKEKIPKQMMVSVALDRIGLEPQTLFKELNRVLQSYQGTVPVTLKIQKRGAFATTLELPLKVEPQESLSRDLGALVSIPGSLRVETLF